MTDTGMNEMAIFLRVRESRGKGDRNPEKKWDFGAEKPAEALRIFSGGLSAPTVEDKETKYYFDNIL